ncbi:hypothetical protein H9P43_007332 [Blastocladiella emersonii ATCC 22665]|nr:hypothetical protein H9P43_007332 [Blastocladiella emersonii ATCC 22665]
MWDFDSDKIPSHYSIVFPADTTWTVAKSAFESTVVSADILSHKFLYWRLPRNAAGTDARVAIDGLLSDPKLTLAQLVAASNSDGGGEKRLVTARGKGKKKRLALPPAATNRKVAAPPGDADPTVPVVLRIVAVPLIDAPGAPVPRDILKQYTVDWMLIFIKVYIAPIGTRFLCPCWIPPTIAVMQTTDCFLPAGSILEHTLGKPLGFYEERPGNVPPRRLSPRLSWRTNNVPFGAVIVVEFAPMPGSCANLRDPARQPCADDYWSDGTSSVAFQVSSLFSAMSELSLQCADPARVQHVVDTAMSAYLVGHALLPRIEHDLRHEYRMVARGRVAPPTFHEWIGESAGGKWREFAWLADPDAPFFAPNEGTAAGRVKQ